MCNFSNFDESFYTMKKILLYTFLFLSILSCKKEEKYVKIKKQPLTKNSNDTIFIQEKCAVFISCTQDEIEREKKEYGEENFYIGIDDKNYYDFEAKTILENKKIKIVNVNHQKVIVFKSKKGDFTVLRDTISEIRCTYLFEPNQLPKHISSIDIEDEYKIYFGEKENLKFSKKEETVKFIYNAIGCSCAQWSNFNDKKSTEKFYLVDDKKLTQDAEDFWDGTSLPLIVEATGSFSENKSIPKDFSPKGDAEREKARIFKYSKIKLVQLGTKKH